MTSPAQISIGSAPYNYAQIQSSVKSRPIRTVRPPRRTRSSIRCSADFSDNVENIPEDDSGLSAKELRWRDIKFDSLQHELRAVDDYEREEELPEGDPWPIFLRGAAYEHWGRPKLALAQYDLLRYSKGLLLVPDLWMRKAYNAFKVGDVVIADAYHEVAAHIRAESVGNQLHFSCWFEEHFADFKPCHNGPPFPLQNAICRYCVDRDSMSYVRNCVAPLVVAKACDPCDIQHAALWMLAACAQLKSRTESVQPSDLATGDMQLAASAFERGSAGKGIAPIAALFLGSSPNGAEDAERLGREEGENALERALYMALYHDAFTKDKGAREEWLDIASSLHQPVCTHDCQDFLFFTARNRLTIPPDSNQDRKTVEDLL